MNIKISLCRCFFGGYDGCDCGSSGVIIGNIDSELHESNSIESIDKKGHSYFNKLNSILDKICSDSYVDLNKTKDNLEKLREKVLDFLSDPENQVIKERCDEVYAEIFEIIDLRLRDELQKQIINELKRNTIQLCDIVFHEGEFYFFSERESIKSLNLLVSYFYDGKRKGQTLHCQELIEFVFNSAEYYENYPYNLHNQQIKIMEIKDRIECLTNIFKSEASKNGTDSFKNVKIFIYNSIGRTAHVYYLTAERFFKTFRLKTDCEIQSVTEPK
ncbi:MAG: hypothetical protein IPL09_07785 [Bacteroidetes bacterium]|nr:hypothetical protein [Bacteroidota bacterium]